MPFVAFIVIDEFCWELVELYPGGANEHGIKLVAPAFTGARNIALDEIPGVLLQCGSSADLLKLAFLLLLVCLCRGAMSGPSHECTLFLICLNRVKTFLSLGSSLVNTVAFTELLWRVGFSPSGEGTCVMRGARAP
ncbi:hypothetical protein Tco_0495725 [Tanacetum coccineum]